MYRKLSFLLFLFSLSYGLQAQWSLGVETGITRNTVITSASNLSFTTYKPVTGYAVGLPVRYEFNNWFSIQADPNITQKGYVYDRTGPYSGYFEEFKNTYLQLPVMAQFRFGGQKLKGFMNMGVFGGYWSGSHINGNLLNALNYNPNSTTTSKEQSYHFSEKGTFDKTRDNRMEMGMVVGAGFSYQLTPLYQVFVEGRYMPSFTDLQKQYMHNQVARYNLTYRISVGVSMKLSKLGSIIK